MCACDFTKRNIHNNKVSSIFLQFWIMKTACGETQQTESKWNVKENIGAPPKKRIYNQNKLRNNVWCLWNRSCTCTFSIGRECWIWTWKCRCNFVNFTFVLAARPMFRYAATVDFTQTTCQACLHQVFACFYHRPNRQQPLAIFRNILNLLQFTHKVNYTAERD